MNNLKHFSPKTDPKINWEKVDMEALHILDKARAIYGKPIRVTSTYREGKQHLSHGETPCTAFDLGYKQKQEVRDWVKSFQGHSPKAFTKRNGKYTYMELSAYFNRYLGPENPHLIKALPDGIGLILACMKAGFPRIGIQMGPGNEHLHIDASPIQLAITGKVVFVE